MIVLTSFVDYDHVLPAIRAGARGYLLKDIEPEELVAGIRRVFQGQVELHPDAAGLLMTHVTSLLERMRPMNPAIRKLRSWISLPAESRKYCS